VLLKVHARRQADGFQGDNDLFSARRLSVGPGGTAAARAHRLEMAGLRAALLLLLLALPASSFEALDSQGRWFDLEAFRGRLVVLEWVNPDCPPWRVYYDPPFMQPMQARYPVVWVWVCSKPGVTPARLNQLAAELGAHPACIIPDPGGRIARLYRPKATPHVFVLNGSQEVVYQGAVDDGESCNYLGEALDQALAGKPVQRPVTQPFG
jgi:hypothetical protein